MKGSRWFIIFIVAFLFIMFAIEYHLPKNFVWKPTFGQTRRAADGEAVRRGAARQANILHADRIL